MPKANEVALWIISFCKKHGDRITNLKLQKLLYYAQAWHLALYNRPLFPEDIEAWTYGPVVPEVYHTFKAFNGEPIEIDQDHSQVDLPEDIVGHLEEIIEVFGGYSSYQLERMTHQEDPWKNARGDVPLGEPSNEVISHEDMANYYTQLIEE